MPKGPPPQWKRRTEPILDAHVIASLNAGAMDERGHYPELIYAGIETPERALRIKRNLFNSAKHLGVSMTAEIEEAGSGYQVRYHAIDKSHARAHMIATYGPDRSNWAYDPRAKGK